jgi:ribonuclease BN (tRNA processing enzyme)
MWRIPAAPFDFVNSFALIEDDGSVTLVDTGTTGSTERIQAGLALAGKSWDDVSRIVLTHAHGDMPEVPRRRPVSRASTVSRSTRSMHRGRATAWLRHGIHGRSVAAC